MKPARLLAAWVLLLAGCCPILVLPIGCPMLCCCPDDDSDSNGDTGTERPLPTGTIRVQIVGAADAGAELTVRFLAEGKTPYMVTLAVAAAANTDVAGPDDTTKIEVEGEYDGGEPLPAATFERDEDFAPGRPAVYTIPRLRPPIPEHQPELSILAPASDVVVQPGASIRVQWTDRDDEHSASIRFYLVPRDALFPGAGAISVGEAFPEDPDDAGDEADLTIPAVTPGAYRLAGIIDDGVTATTAMAAGLVLVAPAPAPCPNPPAITAVDPPSAARNTAVRLTVRGSRFAVGCEVRLARTGEWPILGVGASITADGEAMLCDVSLREAAVGLWDVVVSLPGCADAVLAGAFRVEPWPDFDGDADVDLDDYRFFNACQNGPNRPPPAAVPACDAADFDGDSDVDSADFKRFFDCHNGANRPPAC